MVPFVPNIVTDCKGILDTASRGTAAATAAGSANARIWNILAGYLDGDVSKLADTLVWMPAHQPTSAIGYRVKSDGREMTSLDWRANRLVDHLALHLASPSSDALKGEKLVKSAKAAARHALALLGQVTHKANNHEVKELDENGKVITRVLRDSVDKPKAVAKKKAVKHPVPPAATNDTFSQSELAKLEERAKDIGLVKDKGARRRSKKKVDIVTTGEERKRMSTAAAAAWTATLTGTAQGEEASEWSWAEVQNGAGSSAQPPPAQTIDTGESKEQCVRGLVDISRVCKCAKCCNVRVPSAVCSESDRTCTVAQSPLSRVCSFDGPTRNRPIRGGKSVGSSKADAQAVYSHLGDRKR